MFQRFRFFTCLLIAALTLFIACTDASTIQISGTATEVAGKKLYMERIEPTFTRRLDSTVLSASGSFTFKLKPTGNEPYFLTLRTDSLYLATLLVEKGERVTLTYAAGTYKVEGSEGSLRLKELDSLQQHTEQRLEAFSRADYASEQATLDEANKILVEQKRNNIRFIATHPTSYASIIAILQPFPSGTPMFNRPEDLAYYQLLIDSLQTKYPKGMFVERLKEVYGKMKNEVIFAEKLGSAEVLEGSPNLELPGKDGSKVALSSLRGKVVLLHFWSLATQGSQLQNRELINLREKFGAKGFEVYQVCVDKDRTKWIRAIEQQELPWVSVCDGLGNASLALRTYGVQQVPTSFLLDRKGDIVATNLWGDELERKLASLIAK